MRILRPKEVEDKSSQARGNVLACLGSKGIPSNMLSSEKRFSEPGGLVPASARRPTFPLGSLPQKMANWKPPTGGESAGHLGAGGGAPEGPAVATRWRCGSGDSGRCPTPAPKTWDPGRTGAPLDRAASREGLDPERAEGLSRTLSQTRATGTPLPPSSLRAAARSSRSAAPGG